MSLTAGYRATPTQVPNFLLQGSRVATLSATSRMGENDGGAEHAATQQAQRPGPFREPPSMVGTAPPELGVRGPTLVLLVPKPLTP